MTQWHDSMIDFEGDIAYKIVVKMPEHYEAPFHKGNMLLKIGSLYNDWDVPLHLGIKCFINLDKAQVVFNALRMWLILYHEPNFCDTKHSWWNLQPNAFDNPIVILKVKVGEIVKKEFWRELEPLFGLCAPPMTITAMQITPLEEIP